VTAGSSGPRSAGARTAGGLAAGLGAAAIWGAMFVVSKAVLPVIPPFGLLSLRLILGALALGAVWLITRKPGPVPGANADAAGSSPARWKPWVAVLGAGFVGYGVSLGLQFVGTDLSTASNGALVTCATPAFVALFAGPILKEKIGGRQWAALGLATLGVLAVLGPQLAGFDAGNLGGNLLLVGAALTWGLYTVLTAKAAQGLNLTLASIVGFLGGLPTSLAAGGWEWATRGWGPVDAGIVAGVLFLGLVSTALAMLLWNHAFQVLPASTAGLTFFAQPVTGTLLGALFLGESPGALFFAGAVLIGAALVVGRTK
jgi:drug/metabolite transporter (DMT)-like permease